MGSRILTTSYRETRMVSLNLYTQNIPLTQKAKFWSNYVSSLKGNQDLRANDQNIRNCHPSVIETLPNDYPDLKMEFSKLESQMFDRPLRKAYEPLTPVIADANERWGLRHRKIFSIVQCLMSFTPQGSTL